MKATAIAKTNVLEIVRDLKSHGIVFILPMVFVIIFGFLFSETYDSQLFRVATVESSDESYSGFLEGLKQIKTEEDESVFTFQEFQNVDEAKLALKEGDVDLVFVTGENTPYKFYISETSQRSAIARSIIVEAMTTAEESLWETESIVASTNVSGFQLQAGGLIIYGILIMIPQIAGSLASLKDKKYLFRYSTSRATSIDILAGFTISSLLVGLVQAVLLFFAASWFGLELNSSVVSAFVFIIPVILFAIGTGLLIGALSPKSSTAQDIGTILSIVLGFLSGSFIVGIDRIGYTLGETFISITSIIPTFYAYNGITQIIVFDSSIGSQLSDLLVITVVAILLFFAGAIVWDRNSRRVSV